MRRSGRTKAGRGTSPCHLLLDGLLDGLRTALGCSSGMMFEAGTESWIPLPVQLRPAKFKY